MRFIISEKSNDISLARGKKRWEKENVEMEEKERKGNGVLVGRNEKK